MNSVYRNKINGIFFILLFLSFHLPMLAQEIPEVFRKQYIVFKRTMKWYQEVLIFGII